MIRQMTKQTIIYLCIKQRLWSACASTQSGQSLLCAQWVDMAHSFVHALSEDSRQIDTKAPLSLR